MLRTLGYIQLSIIKILRCNTLKKGNKLSTKIKWVEIPVNQNAKLGCDYSIVNIISVIFCFK